MSEIKVGEYLRCNDGRIFKVNEEEVDYYNYLLKTSINECGIVKHSKNIIDLIEVGDYVNGNIVYEILDDEIELLLGKIKKKRIHFITGHLIDEDEIKSVVTHEQFERMEYKV